MQVIAFALACFACAGAGRRLQVASDSWNSSAPDTRLELDRSESQAEARSLLSPAAMILAALRKPVGGWQVAGCGKGLCVGPRSTVTMKRYTPPTPTKSDSSIRVKKPRYQSPERLQESERRMNNIRKLRQHHLSEDSLLSTVRRLQDGSKKKGPRYSLDELKNKQMEFRSGEPQTHQSYERLASNTVRARLNRFRALDRQKADDDEAPLDPEKEADLFGQPGEWEARKSEKKFVKYIKRQEKQMDEPEVSEEPQTLGDIAAQPEEEEKQKWEVQVEEKKLATFFANAQDFVTLGASKELQATLESMGITQPSRVQGAGFEPMVKGEDVVLADQTGSGKTVAYLAPIVQVLRKIEASEGKTPKGHVRALIVAPTSELCQQVLSVAKAFSTAGMPFRSSIITGEHDWSNQVSQIKRGVDLMICTPGRLLAHLEAGTLSLSLTRHIVLDEADLLFEDDGFPRTWEVIREQVSDHAATAFVTATLPDWLVSLVRKDLPLIKIRKGKNLHRTAAGVTETLVDCSGGRHVSYSGEEGFNIKTDALIREMANHPADRILVFCNTIQSARKVENFLRRRDRRGKMYEVHAFHGAVEPEGRKKTMARFLAEDDEGVDPVPRILVCTDRASRGIDFRAVRHVILFDFPRDGVEYVRRVGRATRGTGAPGHITSLLLGRQVAYARELMKINRAGRAVNLNVHGTTPGNAAKKSSGRK